MSNGDLIPMLPPFTVLEAVSILSEVQDYNLRMMNIPAMWKRTQGSGIKAVILDTGLPSHSDLKPSGGKGFVGGSYLEDKNGHATHCAGILAAIANNNMGVMGIAPDVDDYYGAVLNASGSGSVDSIVAGIRWAVDVVGADLISMSLGFGGSTNREVERACDYAAKQGVVLVAATGNDRRDVSQPARFDSVIAVAAVDEDRNVADFSNFGPEVDFAAGGVNVYSTYLNNRYAKLSGTSMATPALAGVIALILADARLGANGRKLTLAEVREKVTKIAYDVGPKGWDKDYGHGIPVFNNLNDGTPLPPVSPPSRPKKRYPWWQFWRHF